MPVLSSFLSFFPALVTWRAFALLLLQIYRGTKHCLFSSCWDLERTLAITFEPKDLKTEGGKGQNDLWNKELQYAEHCIAALFQKSINVDCLVFQFYLMQVLIWWRVSFKAQAHIRYSNAYMHTWCSFFSFIPSASFSLWKFPSSYRLAAAW